MSERLLPTSTLIAGAGLLVLAIFGMLGTPAERPLGRANVSVPTSWAEQTGSGIFVPACGSSSTSVSCSGGSPRVAFSWSIAGPAPNNVTCSTAAIKVNGSTIASGLPCSGSYEWAGGSPNTTYNYEIIIDTP